MSCTDPTTVESIPLQDIRDAWQRIKQSSLGQTPLVPLHLPGTNAQTKIYLKLESLEPTHSFKVRGACNVLKLLPAEVLANGVYTPSAGNFAQGLAWVAHHMTVPFQAIMPDTAPINKVAGIRQYGGDIVTVTYDQWWQAMQTHTYAGATGQFVHPVCDTRVIAGQGTVGLEILDQLPDVDTVICPFGGGGLSTGTASAIKAIKPQVKVYACEVDVAAPLTASLANAQPITVKDHQKSFVDGMGGKTIFPEMWNLVSHTLDGAIPVSLQEIVDATRLLVENGRVVAEGAGAATVAAALTGKAGTGNIVCVISGGNIDTQQLIQILQGNIPT